MKTKDELQQEALLAIGERQVAGIEVSMGVGKTLIGLKHILSKYHETAKFLIVVPKKAIIKSWKDDAIKFNLEFLIPHLHFTTYLSLAKQSYDYDFICLDECHSIKFTHGDYLSIYTNVHHKPILGLTGTYPKFKRSEKFQMCNRFCPKIFTYTVDDAVNEKILNDYRVIVHGVKLSAEKTLQQKKKNGDTWMSSELKQYNYWNDRFNKAMGEQDRYLATIHRMKTLQMFPSKEIVAKRIFDEQTDKTIVFATTQDQADRLSEYSYHSKNTRSEKNLEMFKTGEVLKLAAVEQLSEGVTIPNLKCGIIIHSYANNRKANQKIGRMLRLNPDETATVHILCYYETVDKQWVTEALSTLDQSKISWILPE